MLSPACENDSFVTLTIDGQSVTVPAGISVAAAILGTDRHQCFCTNTPDAPRNAEPRAPYCLMGVCFDCRAEIDGQPDRQSCLVPVAEGMTVRRMQAGGCRHEE
ncbi:(2Fe-2S)-binding protein [Desulfovibrio sp. OttesenSCG-928-G15]|nr:(2Fe-2S)-binding protein [Desulfovibrio sp. OttesenSCG-928-G15]